jgi:hypothetical protein
MDWAIFWATFSQIHLVTLAAVNVAAGLPDGIVAYPKNLNFGLF